MSDPTRPIVRRRPRCVFHYKVDETLSVEHRDPYLSLLRDPRTTIDAAHAWLRDRGYTMSRSAVARHRRQTLTRDAEHRATTESALAFAQIAGGPDTPDFAAGATVQLQYLVFQRLMAIGEIMHAAGVDVAAADPDGNDRGLDENERAARVARAMQEIPSSELLTLSRLVAQCVELSRGTPSRPVGVIPPSDPVPPETDEQRLARERANAEEILFGKTASKGSCGAG